VSKTQDAVTILLQEEFGVVVLDNDASSVEATSFSKIIRVNHPLVRIVVISNDCTPSNIKTLINEGSVDAFLPIPIDDFSAYSVIVEQQAKYEISKMLNQYVLRPPKFTPAYYLLHDPSLSFHEPKAKLQFTGCVVSYSSITRYSLFMKDFLNIDEYLLSGYISAISLLGEQLLENNELLEIINFGGNSIFFHFERGLQFAVFFRNLTEANHKEAEAIISVIAKNLMEHCYSILANENSIHKDEDQLITNIIEINLNIKSHLPLVQTNSHDKSKIVFFGTSFPKFNEIIKPFSREFEIVRQKDVDSTIEHVCVNESDVLIINTLSGSDIQNVSLAARVKDLSPGVQIIGLLKELTSNELLQVLNSETVDYVLSHTDEPTEFYTIIKDATGRASRIKSHSNPNKLMMAYDQSAITKSLIKSQERSFQKIKTPDLYGLFIAKDIMPFYSHFWKQAEDTFQIDQQLFAGFISSLVSFSDETFQSSSDLFSGMKFGDASLITRHLYDYTYVFFVRNIDTTNTFLVSKHIDQTVGTIHDVLLMAETKDQSIESWDKELSSKIEQAGVELFLKLSSMSTTRK
jgi:DNA-binding NarL/FixJ family response regulator